jgi:hypothetical protein
MVLPILFGLFGSIWYYASNSVLQTGVEVLPDKIDVAFHDINLYINNTVIQLDHLAVENFGEVRTKFNETLIDTGDELDKTFEEIKTEIHFDEIIDTSTSIIDQSLNFNEGTLKDVQTKIDILKDNATFIKEKVEAIKKSVKELTSDTSSPLCSALQGELSCVILQSSMAAIDVDPSKVPSPILDSFKIPDVSMASMVKH